MISRFHALAGIALAIGPAASEAQQTSIEELQKQLEQRDKVIVELLERVEALERRVDISRQRSADTAGPAGGTGDRASPGKHRTNAQEQAEIQSTKPANTTPGRVVIDEDAAERALERSLTQAGALLLRAGQTELQPSFTYARNEGVTATFVNRRGRTLAGQRERNADTLIADVSLRLGLPWDSQLEAGLPYRWRHVENVTSVGFSPVAASNATGAAVGDLRVGGAKTLLREGPWRPDLIGRVTWDTDTGSAADDGVSLGGGFHELRGSLIAIKRQDPVVFVGSIAYEHTFEHANLQPGQMFSLSFGSVIAFSPETSLRLLFSGGYQQETEAFGMNVNGSDRLIGSFVVGGSTLVAPGVLIDLSTGIGLTDDADDFSVSLSIPLRFNWPNF